MRLGVDSYSSDGFVIDFNSNNVNRVALKVNATSNTGKVFEVNNTTSNQNVFSVLGNGQLTLRTVESDGNVFNVKDNSGADVFRIGTTGIVWSTEVNVALKQDFPDYVFSPEYKLLSFDNLRKYIALENHLPNVPTAEEVKENGLALGEMQRVQMEKVEENTLYILQLEERIKKLEEQNAKMIQLIENLQNN